MLLCRQLGADTDSNQRRLKKGLSKEQRQELQDRRRAEWLPDLITAALWEARSTRPVGLYLL